MQKQTKTIKCQDHIAWLSYSKKSHSKNANPKKLDLPSEPNVMLLLHLEEPARRVS